MSRKLPIASMFLLIVIASVAASQDDQQRSANEEVGLNEAKPDGSVPGKEQFTADDIQQGRQSVNSSCSRCHGRDGRGSKGPDLTNGVFRHAKSDRDIIDIISNGIPGTGMPGFGAGYDDFNWSTVAYIRFEAANAKSKAAPPAGDVAHGKELFKKHNCASCHWTGSDGGRLGTNLSRLTATADYVRESMRYPNSQIDGTHQQVTLLDKDAKVLTGKRLRENTYHILVMDQQENLHSVAKQDLEQMEFVRASLMPSFKDVLSEEDIEDLTTYLFSLKKAQ